MDSGATWHEESAAEQVQDGPSMVSRQFLCGFAVIVWFGSCCEGWQSLCGTSPTLAVLTPLACRHTGRPFGKLEWLVCLARASIPVSNSVLSSSAGLLGQDFQGRASSLQS